MTKTMIYVCTNKVCKLPVEDVEKALAQIKNNVKVYKKKIEQARSLWFFNFLFFNHNKQNKMLLLGIDLGTSSIKVSVVNAETQKSIATTQYPEIEVDIISQ